jgi:hypothetical protein
MAGIAVADVSILKICYRSTMKWLEWTPDRNANAVIVLVLIALVSLFAFFVIYFPNFQQRKAVAGFGPEWECSVQPKGDPVCVRKAGQRP